MPAKLTNEIIAAAIEGFEGQRKRLDEHIAELRQMLRNGATSVASSSPEPASAPAKRKRRLSAAGRKAIADAARKRWAAVKAAKTAEAPAAFGRRGGRKAKAKE